MQYDYVEIANGIADTLAMVTKPFTNEQRQRIPQASNQRKG